MIGRNYTMSKSSRLLSSDQIKNSQIRQTWRKNLDKAWTMIVIFGLLAIVVYSVVIQILHHP